MKAKIRALTRRTSQLNLRYVLIRLNQIMRSWSAYFKHAVAKHTFDTIREFAWRRVVTMVRVRHRWKWPDVRRWLIGHPTADGNRQRPMATANGRWQPPTVDGIALFNIAVVPVTRYRHRGTKIPNPWIQPTNA